MQTFGLTKMHAIAQDHSPSINFRPLTRSCYRYATLVDFSWRSVLQCVITVGSWFNWEQIIFLSRPVFRFWTSLLYCAFIIKPDIFVFSQLKEPDKVASRYGPNHGVSYINFVEEKFSYLNITTLGGDFVVNMPECWFACLDIPPCFSFNLGTTTEANDRFRCELLPSDKYNNSDKFAQSLMVSQLQHRGKWELRKTGWHRSWKPEILEIQVKLWPPAKFVAGWMPWN